MASVLFVLGGLGVGGVETYIVRLARELSSSGYEVDVILLSGKSDADLLLSLSRHASVYVCERFSFFSASSWLNAFWPWRGLGKKRYDVVHVVDLLTLGFVFLNKSAIEFAGLSIGIYHSKEISWWRDKSCYFRSKLIELYDKNVQLTVFPNESTAFLASGFTGFPADEMLVVPLGIELDAYRGSLSSRESLKIVSVGRLVDFKTYNRNIISQLAKIRVVAPFQYYIYGDGPERCALENYAREVGVSEYVHFMGEVKYEELPKVFSGIFCFVGSGTTIIEASAAGVPSIVGIESILEPVTCGLFSDVEGFSYNEGFATTRRLSISDVVCSLYEMSDKEYRLCSERHRLKASQFDLAVTADDFIEASDRLPDFDFEMNRWRALSSFLFSVVKYGPAALRSRFNS